jgi:hypothetical protein
VEQAGGGSRGESDLCFGCGDLSVDCRSTSRITLECSAGGVDFVASRPSLGVGALRAKLGLRFHSALEAGKRTVAGGRAGL